MINDMNSPVKALVIQKSVNLPSGGIIAQQIIIDALRRLGNDVYTISFCGNYPETFQKFHFTTNIRNNSQSRWNKYSYNRNIYKLIRDVIAQVTPDIIFLGQMWSLLSIIAAVRKCELPVIHIVHSAEYGCLNAMLTQKDTLTVCCGHVGLKCLRHRCEAVFSFLPKVVIHSIRNFLIKRYVDAFVCHSNFMVNFLEKQSFENVYYVPLNLDTDVICKTKNDSNHNKNKHIELLFVGVLSWHKGIMELVEAMNIICGKSSLYHLTIIGEGKLLSKIKEFIKLQRLEEFISLVGFVFRDALKQYYTNADIIIFPSYFESFGLVALEAMLHNKYLITSDRGALKELISNYPKVKVLSEINPPNIADAILECKNEIKYDRSEYKQPSFPNVDKISLNSTRDALDSILYDFSL